jgi:hypothetical protein
VKSGIACRALFRVALLKPRSTADLQCIFDETQPRIGANEKEKE